MSIYSKLYWLTRLDMLHGILLALAIISTVVFIAYFFFLCISFDHDSLEEWDGSYGKIRKGALVVFLSVAPFLLFLPTKRDVIFIIAGGKTIDFIQSDSSINKIPSQTTKIVSDFLNKQIKSIEATK